ncbi:MAG: hypothetical protein ACPG4U_02745 [Pseudomonadales bacterium]
MNRHTKVAILVAPILAIFGFAGTDMYKEHQASQKVIYPLSNDKGCDISAEKCILKADELLLSFSQQDDHTVVNTTFALDTATLFLVDSQGEATAYPLGMTTSPYYWRASTGLDRQLKAPGAVQKLRIIANIKGASYISEFTSTTR